MSPAEQRAGVRGAAAGGEAGPLEPGTRPRVSAPGSLQPPHYNLSRTQPAPVCTRLHCSWPRVYSNVQCLVYSNVAAAGVETALATPGLHAASLCCALSISSSDLAPHRRLHSWCEASPQPGRCCCSQHTPSQNKDVISSASVTLYFCLN